jgi:hypothetical protein
MAYALGLWHLGYKYAMDCASGNSLAMNEPKRNLTVMAHRLPVVLTALPDEKVLSAKAAAATAEALGKSPENAWNPAGALPSFALMRKNYSCGQLCQ